MNPAWATQETLSKKKFRYYGFYFDPQIHWQQILTLNTAFMSRWFLKNVDGPQACVESRKVLGKGKCGHV